MKKFILTTIFLVSFIGYIAGQNYNNIVNYDLIGTPTYGVKIKTNIPFSNYIGMPIVKIEGYNYGDTSLPGRPPAVLSLNIVWYVSGDKFNGTSVSSSGGSSPKVWLSVENGKVVVFIDQKIYFQRFTISAFSQGRSEKPEYFQNWTVVDQPLGGTGQTLIPYKNTFGGNVGIGVEQPTHPLHTEGSIRIGKVGDGGNRSVPFGAVTTQYDIDFTGYRDVLRDQIGARISAIRFNKYAENNALIQKTALTFYTNPLGQNAGTTDLVERMRITPEGNIGIGTDKPDELLTVNGKIHAREVIIDLNGPLADFVFDPTYKLRALSEVEAFVKENKHLPEIPSAAAVVEKGLSIGDMQNKLLQKIEELTLYTIQQQKQLEAQSKQIEALEQQISSK